MTQDQWFNPGNKKKLLRRHRTNLKPGQDLMALTFGKDLTEVMADETAQGDERMLTEMPYIGGWEISFTDTQTQGGSIPALDFVLKQHGEPVERIGDLVHRICDRKVAATPSWLRILLGRLDMSGLWRRRTMHKARVSQRRIHPGDFVLEVVNGRQNEFSWGINYLECAIAKFFHQQGADEFTPYMCYVDSILFPAMGIDLKRTGTIGQGCSHCDFRFNKLTNKNP